MRPQISFKISCVRKIQSCLTEPIEHSQQYRYCNWPELEHKSFDRSALQHGSTGNCFSNRYLLLWHNGREISTPIELLWPIHFTQISIPQAQVWSVVWPQVKIVFVTQESRLGLLLAQVFYSLLSYMWRIPYYNLSCFTTCNKLNVCTLTVNCVWYYTLYPFPSPPKVKIWKIFFPGVFMNGEHRQYSLEWHLSHWCNKLDGKRLVLSISFIILKPSVD